MGREGGAQHRNRVITETRRSYRSRPFRAAPSYAPPILEWMRSRTGAGDISLPAFACCRVIIEYLDCCVRQFDKANPLCLQGGYRLPDRAPPFSLAVRWGRARVRLSWPRFAKGVVSAG